MPADHGAGAPPERERPAADAADAADGRNAPDGQDAADAADGQDAAAASGAAAPDAERFRPGGVQHALISGLVETAVASAALGVALEQGDAQDRVGASLTALAVLWGALAVYSLTLAALRAWVFEAILDSTAVTLRGLNGARRLRYEDLSAVEIRRSQTRLVGRDNRVHAVRGVRGRPQGERFRARVLARAHAAAEAEIADSFRDSYSQTQAHEPDNQDRDDEQRQTRG